MIPIDEQRLPDFVKRDRKRRLLITILLLLIIVGGGYFSLFMIRESLQKGIDHTDMDNAIAERMFDSAAIGLDYYYRIHGQYPQISGKYFVDSIKKYLRPRAYTYADSITATGDTTVVEWRGYRDSVFYKYSHIYFGIGNPTKTILYIPLSNTSYRLIYVGTNGIDEGGDGDDLVYEKER